MRAIVKMSVLHHEIDFYTRRNQLPTTARNKIDHLIVAKVIARYVQVTYWSRNQFFTYKYHDRGNMTHKNVLFQRTQIQWLIKFAANITRACLGLL